MMMLRELEHLSSAVNIPYARLKCLARSGHPDTLKQCLLSRVKRTSPFQSVMSAFGPKTDIGQLPNLACKPKSASSSLLAQPATIFIPSLW
jgi:hypothetical protein